MTDSQFPTNNWLDIPVLDLSRQPQALELPLLQWGSIRKSSENTGTWHFYVDDHKFSHIWSEPDQVLDTNAVQVVEPNFSVYAQTPFPVALWNTYRKRWLGRHWQDRGLDVFVDMNVNVSYAQLNLVGVPRGWRCYCTRGYADRIGDLDVEWHLAKTRAESEPLFVVYAGGMEVREKCHERGWLYVEDARGSVRAALQQARLLKGV